MTLDWRLNPKRNYPSNHKKTDGEDIILFEKKRNSLELLHRGVSKIWLSWCYSWYGHETMLLSWLYDKVHCQTQTRCSKYPLNRTAFYTDVLICLSKKRGYKLQINHRSKRNSLVTTEFRYFISIPFLILNSGYLFGNKRQRWCTFWLWTRHKLAWFIISFILQRTLLVSFLCHWTLLTGSLGVILL